MKQLATFPAIIAVIVLGGCTSNGDTVAASSASAKAPANPAEVGTSSSPLGTVVYDSQSRRDCRRKVRRTATRIPRGECETSVFGKAYHMPSGKPDTPVRGGDNN